MNEANNFEYLLNEDCYLYIQIIYRVIKKGTPNFKILTI